MTDRTAVSTDGAPTPTGPFSQAIRAGNLVFTAGQAGRNRDTGQMGDIGEQADWALRNISNILAAAGRFDGRRGEDHRLPQGGHPHGSPQRTVGQAFQ